VTGVQTCALPISDQFEVFETDEPEDTMQNECKS
jgi:hypothetical protein